MPNINRIRVNNVKYNFGTQGYDDFSMRMYGKNTLYDLANGGGKSVLMLLLLQNLIPNCTLDEKQPIEKLFRTGGGNTTIHSLVEWRLDDKDIKEGMRYMTTGFCARKAKEVSVDDGTLSLPDEVMNSAGESVAAGGSISDGATAGALSAVTGKSSGKSAVKENASIEYFNYCIFYRDYNENDIINLPLQNAKERITYSGLKNYLKDLSKRNLNIKVYVFERKGEYQRFISRYGLFESQWEIIRGINKTEGHVRTYFETQYKTTRKVVEDLLIEEIIEKAFLVKTEQNDVNEDMARTLLDIKDKLVELSKKKREISNFDKETELMHLLEGRVSSFLSLYEEKDRVVSVLSDIYATGEHLCKQGEEEIEKRKQKKEEMDEKLLLQRRRIEELKIVKDKYELKEEEDELGTLKQHLERAEKELDNARRELDIKESINDYLQYLADRAAMQENRAVIDASMEDNSDVISKLHVYAFTKKKMDDEKLSGLRKQLKEKQEELSKVSEELSKMTHVREEGTTALAIAKSHREHFAKEYEQCMEEIRKVRSGISLLVLSDISELMSELEKEGVQLEQREKDCEEAYASDIEKLGEVKQNIFELNKEHELLVKESAEASEKLSTYLENKDRLKNMLKIYDVKEQELLYESVKERAFKHTIRLAELEKKMAKVEKHLAEVREGRILEETDAISKVKDYMESRHGEFVISGVDYLSAVPTVNREDLLARFPMLPYGVVTKNFDLIKEDVKIHELDLGNQMVPVFDQNKIESPYIPEQSEGMLLLSKDNKVFTEEEALSYEIEHLEKELSEYREDLAALKELEKTYNEDMDYIASLHGLSLENAEAKVREAKEKLLEHERLSDKYENQVSELTAHRDRMKEEASKIREDLAVNNQERIKLAGIVSISRQADEAKGSLDFYEAEVKRLLNDTETVNSEYENVRLKEADLKSQVSHIEIKIKEMLNEWEELYKDYYVDENLTAVNIPEDQLRAEFLAAKALAEEATVVLEDKKKLIETLNISMERGLKLIERRKIEVEYLEELNKKGELHPSDEAYINQLSGYVSQISVRLDQLEAETKKKEKETTRLEGRIEQAVMALKERFGNDAGRVFEEIDKEAVVRNNGNTDADAYNLDSNSLLSLSREEVVQALSEGDRILKEMSAAIKQYNDEYQSYIKNHGVIVDLYKDVKRIIQSEELDVKEGHLLSGDQNHIRETFEESLLSYDKSNKALARAKQELNNFKTQTANTFFAMGAFELSSSMKDDVEVPDTYEEAKNLLANIREMISYIALEKERVLQGIEDMETIKNNFENQCIERCKDVRTELEKLPKLSRIQLDGEMIQMVNLTIPYVKDEFIKQRMSDYIDEVVTGADRFEDNNDRIKYMKNMLLLKKLFGVMVTDMNAIKLKLYKRERIKDQSRYLRYEEAVGSTGQSQGIYIQFLVSIINYISGMYAPEAEASDLKKVIFIDNPFGAAKDIYIWEPIFALLATNNVQLIVPARGATPAITNRFDVNYILGQQLVGGRQQTVVVDYRSQVEAHEMEYENLEYSQGTFDFI